MSAFDDEFGLFGDDEEKPEEERKSTLGARQIATNESFSDDIEPEDERPARRRSGRRPQRSRPAATAVRIATAITDRVRQAIPPSRKRAPSNS